MERRNSGNFLNVRYWSSCMMLTILVVSGFCLILFKAFRLQVVEHQVWADRIRAQAGTTLEVPSYRGSIYDRRGRLLSYSVPQRSLYASCDQMENPKRVSASLAPILGDTQESLEKKLTCGRRFVWLKRHLTDLQALAVENLKARGLNLVNEYKRFYPYGQVAGQLLGFVGLDGSGLEGVEKAYDNVLHKRSVSVAQLRDGVKKCLWLGTEAPPEPAESLGVRLSIDAFIQYLCESELEKAALQYKARAGEVVVMDAETFEVLAMANWPFFDPNLSDKKSADSWRNRSVTDAFEPGSTFKVFVVSGALEEGLIKEKDRIFCENGRGTLAGHSVKDDHPHGWLTISEVIKYSSNIAAGKIALQLGREKYYQYIRSFGFGQLTGSGLPGETRGLLRSWKRWQPIDLAVTGFGQSIGVTALQLTTGIACVARGGEYLQPVVVKELVDSCGESVKLPDSTRVRRVIQKKTADKMRDMMVTVTQEGGTGVKAVPEGFTVAAKTGTAQVLDRETRRYSTNKYTSVLTGFIPAERPRLVITVVIHEPHGAIYGGVVSAPAFRNIAARALPYLGVLPNNIENGAPADLKMVKTGTAAPGKAPSAPSAPPSTDKKKPPSGAVKKIAERTDRPVNSTASASVAKDFVATSRRDASKPSIAN